MNDSKISVRYAKALFESAKEKDLLTQVREDMLVVQNVSQVPEFKEMLKNPVIKESQKIAVLNGIFKNQINPLSLALLELVFKNGREWYIPGIARNYIDLFKKHNGIISAVFTSAGEVSVELKGKIEKIIQDAVKSTIELEVESNADLIGGFIIRLENQQYDASVANSLKKVKKQLLN